MFLCIGEKKRLEIDKQKSIKIVVENLRSFNFYEEEKKVLLTK